MDIEWEKKTGKHQSGEWARVGKVVVGSAQYSAFGRKGDPAKYDCACLLPGIKQAAEKYETLDEAKARLERQVRTWFAWTQQDHNQ